MNKSTLTYRPDQANEFYTEERCFIMELLNKSSIPSISFAQARVAPGIQTQLHALRDTEEYYYITQGEGIVEIDGKMATVGKGDLVHIPPNTPQQIQNIAQEDLLFICVCLPRFEEKAYVNLES